MSERLSPSDVAEYEDQGNDLIENTEGVGIDLLILCDEIRACWADLAAATAAMKQRSDELALLEAIALAVAEEEAQSPATESAAFAALRDWQKWKREG